MKRISLGVLLARLLEVSAAVAPSRRALLASSAAAALRYEPRRALAATTPKCLVVGATGRTGRRLLELLPAAGWEPLAAVRADDASPSLLPATVSVVPGIDLAADGLAQSLSHELVARDVRAVICAAGFAPTFVPAEDRRLAEQVDGLGTRRLVAACEAARLPGRLVLVSSLGVNATASSQSARLLDASLGNVLQQKAVAEAACRASALDWCIVRPGLLQRDTAAGGVLLGPEDRWLGADADADRSHLGPRVSCPSPFLASSGAVCATSRRQLAAVCVSALDGPPDLYSRRVVEMVARPELPQGEIRRLVDFEG